MEICSMKMMIMSVLVFSLCVGGRRVEAKEVHHFLGGDRGWDLATDIQTWASTREFKVGDIIWFTYSAAQDSVAEVRSMEEYLSCDTTNPIKMYTDGVSKVGLEGEGTRFFVSSKPENCKNGLKVHVEVLPNPDAKAQTITTGMVKAESPTIIPSGSVGLTGMSILVYFGLAVVFYVGWA